uniref:BEN domain-containing protein n=1 Tax=Bactrocera latifrons TaxID=174628 RepID=A0A0K8UEF4_BACLA
MMNTKKLKLDEIILPETEDTPRNEVHTATVQTLLYINMLQTIMQTISMMREPANTEFPSELQHPMGKDNGEGDYKIIPCTSSKTEPINVSNILTTGNSLLETPSAGNQVSDSIIFKQELTDQENISPNVSNADHQSVSPANEESPDVEIGPYGTRVSKKDLAKIDGMEVSIATRKLLTLIFDRQTLATHTLSGKPSNRFLKSNRPTKPQLNPLKVADITYYVKRVFNCTEPDIRHTITMKCAEIDRIVKKRSLSKTNLD